jgi:hypothetical protein
MLIGILTARVSLPRLHISRRRISESQFFEFARGIQLATSRYACFDRHLRTTSRPPAKDGRFPNCRISGNAIRPSNDLLPSFYSFRRYFSSVIRRLCQRTIAQSLPHRRVSAVGCSNSPAAMAGWSSACTSGAPRKRGCWPRAWRPTVLRGRAPCSKASSVPQGVLHEMGRSRTDPRPRRGVCRFFHGIEALSVPRMPRSGRCAICRPGTALAAGGRGDHPHRYPAHGLAPQHPGAGRSDAGPVQHSVLRCTRTPPRGTQPRILRRDRPPRSRDPRPLPARPAGAGGRRGARRDGEHGDDHAGRRPPFRGPCRERDARTQRARGQIPAPDPRRARRTRCDGAFRTPAEAGRRAEPRLARGSAVALMVPGTLLTGLYVDLTLSMDPEGCLLWHVSSNFKIPNTSMSILLTS